MSNSLYSLGYVDHYGARSSVSLILPQITAANHDNTVNVAIDALMDAMNALSEGNLITRTLTHSVVTSPLELPAAVTAKKGNAVQFHYSYLDGNGDATPGYISVPVADLAAFSFPTGQTQVQRADFNVAEEALADAMETYCESPDGTAITVLKEVLVNRS